MTQRAPSASDLTTASQALTMRFVVASFIPANKCVRLQWVFTNADGSEGSVRWYYTYSGVAPSGANLTAAMAPARSSPDGTAC